MHGYRQHGYGRIGRHRKHPAGRGKAGGEHHKRIMFTKYYPGHFGKNGMKDYHRQPIKLPYINVDRLWSLVPENERENMMKQATCGKAPVIDVTQFGYYGVLGAGAKLTHPVIVKARSFTKLA